MSGHFIGIAPHYDFLRAKVERILTLRFEGGEGDNPGPHGVGELDPHMAPGHRSRRCPLSCQAPPVSGAGVNRR
jgi:hypothetical protein